jgi:alcohol dehydrogenase
MVGETLVGGASELFATEARYLLPVPDAVSFVDAACLPVAYGTALRMMETRAQLKAGEKVLILSAAGGVGTCCVQLAKAAGCEVVACASSGTRAERLKGIGADHVVDTSQQNYVAEIHKLYGKPRIAAAAARRRHRQLYWRRTWAECLRCARPPRPVC